MTASRLDQLLSFENETPNDPFIIYGIALEYLNSAPDKAQVYFKKLLEEHSHYLPTYYKAAQFAESQNRFEEALELYEKGIALATQQGDQHAKAELSTALGFLKEDLED